MPAGLRALGSFTFGGVAGMLIHAAVRWLIFGAVLAAAAVPTALANDGPAQCPDLQPGPLHTVTRIIDGETVALDDGRELRLVGALAPRAIDVGAEAGTWPPEIAAAAELKALLLGKSVELALGGESIDRYGRLQAHAFVREGSERRWVQGHMLAQGHARAYGQAGNRACMRALLAAERAEAKRGLWADAAYGIRQATPSRLGRHHSTFQVIEGRIVRVAQVRGTIYLNFGRNWRRAFSVSLRRGDHDLLGDAARDPSALEGTQVRVRGWIEQRRAPTIDVSAAGVIEVLELQAPATAGVPGPR
jgi:micrococcal nuclease